METQVRSGDHQFVRQKDQFHAAAPDRVHRPPPGDPQQAADDHRRRIAEHQKAQRAQV